jgi:hypothetical protein
VISVLTETAGADSPPTRTADQVEPDGGGGGRSGRSLCGCAGLLPEAIGAVEPMRHYRVPYRLGMAAMARSFVARFAIAAAAGGSPAPRPARRKGPLMRAMRFRLWHWMAIVVVVALAVTGYLVWSRPKPLNVTQSSYLRPNVSAPAPGVLQIGAKMEFIDLLRSGTYFWKVVVIKKDDRGLSWTGPYDPGPAIWKQVFDDAEHLHHSVKGKAAIFELAPFDLQVDPGHYQVWIYFFEDGRTQGKAHVLDMGTSVNVTVD